MNATSKQGMTPLMLAFHHKNVYAAKVLLKAGADVNATTCMHNCTPLTYAVAHKDTDAINLLLKAGADPNIVFDESSDIRIRGVPCLLYAVFKYCSKEALQAIIDYGAHVNATSEENLTALMIACYKGCTDAIILLLKAGANPNIAIDHIGATCLMHAVDAYCSKDVLQAIIDHGADVNATNKENLTALMIPCAKRYTNAVNVLLETGADPNIALDNGLTCLMYVVGGDYSKEVLQALIDHRANVNATREGNHTALMIACAKSYTDAINVLLETDADPNIADDSGATCLMYAVFKDCSKDMPHAIIDHGADVNATSKENCTALMIACGKSSIGAINVLLESGADTNIANMNGNTCLMCVVDGECVTLR